MSETIEALRHAPELSGDASLRACFLGCRLEFGRSIRKLDPKAGAFADFGLDTNATSHAVDGLADEGQSDAGSWISIM